MLNMIKKIFKKNQIIIHNIIRNNNFFQEKMTNNFINY